MTSNLDKWLHTLRTTDLAQGTSELHAVIYSNFTGDEKHEEMCCLGVGCKLMGLQPILNEDNGQVAYGKNHNTDLAPYEFVDWLGIDFTTNPDGAYDVYPVIDGGIEIIDRNGEPISGARMNDGGCTFAEIADVLGHFELVAR